MPVGKKTTASVRCTAKAQEPRIPGPSSHFQAVEHLQAGYRLLIAVQPFDDVVAGYTSRNSDDKRQQLFRKMHPLSVPGIGAVTL